MENIHCLTKYPHDKTVTNPQISEINASGF